METVRRFAVGLLGIGLVWSLVAFAGTYAIDRVFHNPETIKQTLTESNVYPPATEALVELGIKNAGSSSDIPLTDPAVKKALEEAVPISLVQKNTEQVIDSLYAWSRSSTDLPDFVINVQLLKNDIAKNISTAGQKRIENLPICTFAQLLQIDPANSNPFTLSCRPPGANLEVLRRSYEHQIVQSNAFLTDPKITAHDFKDVTGRSIFANRGKKIIAVLERLFVVLVISGITGILSMLGIMFLCSTKRSGLKIVSILLVVSGIVVGLLVIIANFIPGIITSNVEQAETLALKDVGLLIGKSIITAINNVLVIFATLYASVGAGGIVLFYYKSRIVSARTNTTLPEANHRKS